METANDTAMHVTETKTLCSSLNRPKTRNDEIITNEKESELLYGNNEDGEDEDAFSEDSLRLKLSDDEAEDHQPAGRDVSSEKTKREITNMELGSDVSSGDSSERNISFRGENLTNGNCNVEINLNYVEAEEEEECIEDFASDTIPETDKFYSCQDKYSNGDSDETMNIPFEQSLGGNMSSNQWHYSGHFGNYSRRGKRNSVPRKPYTQSDRYFDNSYEADSEHINNLYVRGRTSGRGYSLYHSREENTNYEMPVKDEFYTPTSSPMEPSNEQLKNKQIIDGESMKENSIDRTIDSSDSSNSCSNYINSELKNSSDSRDFVITKPEITNFTSKNDENLEVTSGSPSNFNLIDEENQENSSSKCESSIVDSTNEKKSNENNPNDENKINDDGNEAVASLPVESKNIEKNFCAAKESSTSEIELENIENEKINDTNFEQTKLDNEKNDDFARKERKQENMKIDKVAMEERELDSVKNDEVAMEKNEEDNEKNDDVVIKDTKFDDVKNDTKCDDVKNDTKFDDVKNDNISTKQTKSDENDDTQMKKIIFEKEENVAVTKNPNESKNDETSRMILVEQNSMKFNHEENQTKDSPSSEINEAKSKEMDVTEFVEKIPQNFHNIDKNDDRENSSTLEEFTKLSSDLELQKKEKKESEKLDDQSMTINKEKFDISETQQASKDLSLVAIEANKTIEEKIIDNEKKTSDDDKISLSKSVDDENDGEVRPVNEMDDNNASLLHCLLKRSSSGMSLDEMELSKRIRIGRKKNDDTSESECREIDFSSIESSKDTSHEIVKMDNNDKTIINNIVTNSNMENLNFHSNEGITSFNFVEKSSSENIHKDTDEKSETSGVDDNKNEKIDDCEVIEVPVKQKQKRSKKSLNSPRDNVFSQEDPQETDNVRQKRKTAQNAEEIIRKEFQSHSDSESNDSLGKFVVVNYNKSNNNLRSASPPTLKRNYDDGDEKGEGMITKKLKQDVNCNGNVSPKKETLDDNKKQILRHVRNFFRRDANGSLCKLRQEELEELLIQKVVETITMRDEIGKLREQAKISERNQEATRVRCQQLAKQIKDFDMVLNRYKSDIRLNPESKNVVPIKINRSVGLQVNFVTDHGIQNLRQLQQVQKTSTPTVNGAITTNQHNEQSSGSSIVKRSMKVRSPRRPEAQVAVPVVTATATIPVVQSPHVSTATPAALVVSKSNSDTRLSVTPAIQQATLPHPQLVSSNQGLLVNGNIANQPIRPAPTHHVSKTKSSDLIDLTQEEDKTKVTIGQNSMSITPINDTSPRVSNVQNIAPRYHTVIQTLPASMAITAQSGIRVVQPSSQPTPTALVNNMNAPRLTYVTMQGGIVPTRQVVITSTPTPIRPAPANNIRTTFPISGTISNNTVRVIPATASGTILYKHPAALPDSLNLLSNPGWKLPPPAPSLKISKVANGIVLSWNMALSDKYAEIASYQLYAYQEVSGIPPNSTLWKKVGDVRALPLPMACTLTQFSEGNNYYFAVRAVDKHSRLGQYSLPGNISL